MFERIRRLKKKKNYLELCRWMGPGQGRGCLCAPPTPTSTACLWGVGWITEGFLQDFTEKKIFLSHLQPLRSSPVASTNRNAANLATLKCRLYAFLASQTVIKRRCVMREQRGNGCGGWASSNNVGLLFVPNRRRYTTRRLDTPLSLAKPVVVAPQKVQVKKSELRQHVMKSERAIGESWYDAKEISIVAAACLCVCSSTSSNFSRQKQTETLFTTLVGVEFTKNVHPITALVLLKESPPPGPKK